MTTSNANTGMVSLALIVGVGALVWVFIIMFIIIPQMDSRVSKAERDLCQMHPAFVADTCEKGK